MPSLVSLRFSHESPDRDAALISITSADFRHFDANKVRSAFGLNGDEQLRATRFRANSIQHAANTVAGGSFRAAVYSRRITASASAIPSDFYFQRDIVAVHFLQHASDDFAFLVAN